MTYEQMGFAMHVAATLGLLYLLWQWVRSVSDFAGGVARVGMWWSRNAFAYQRVEEPRGFWISTAVKIVILGFLTAICVMLLVSP